MVRIFYTSTHSNTAVALEELADAANAFAENNGVYIVSMGQLFTNGYYVALPVLFSRTKRYINGGTETSE